MNLEYNMNLVLFLDTANRMQTIEHFSPVILRQNHFSETQKLKSQYFPLAVIITPTTQFDTHRYFDCKIIIILYYALLLCLQVEGLSLHILANFNRHQRRES